VRGRARAGAGNLIDAAAEDSEARPPQIHSLQDKEVSLARETAAEKKARIAKEEAKAKRDAAKTTVAPVASEETDLFDKLDQEPASSWVPEDGDKLVGTVTSIGSWTGDYGTSTTVTIEVEKGSTEEGEQIDAGELRTFYASSTAAASQLERANPSVGDRIGVAYKGKATGKSGREYHDYRVAVDRKVPLAAAAAIAPREPAGDEPAAEAEPLGDDW
jgi:hypothetical protein